MSITIMRYDDNGNPERRPLTQNDRDALFGPMFSLPRKTVAWEIEAIEDGSTRIKLCKMPRVKANVPTLEITGAWYDLVDAVNAYVKRFHLLHESETQCGRLPL